MVLPRTEKISFKLLSAFTFEQCANIDFATHEIFQKFGCTNIYLMTD